MAHKMPPYQVRALWIDPTLCHGLRDMYIRILQDLIEQIKAKNSMPNSVEFSYEMNRYQYIMSMSYYDDWCLMGGLEEIMTVRWFSDTPPEMRGDFEIPLRFNKDNAISLVSRVIAEISNGIKLPVAIDFELTIWNGEAMLYGIKPGSQVEFSEPTGIL